MWRAWCIWQAFAVDEMLGRYVVSTTEGWLIFESQEDYFEWLMED